MSNRFQERVKATARSSITSLPRLLNRVALYVGVALLVVVFLERSQRTASTLSSVDCRDLTMRTNFGPDWRNVMLGAALTNHVQFEQMKIILKSVE